MTKDIKDYLHLYLRSDLHCKVKRKNDTEYNIGRLCEVTYKSNHGDWASFWFEDVITVTSQTWETSSSNNHWFFFGEDSIIPLLRPLSDMTEEEAGYVADFIFTDDVPYAKRIEIGKNFINYQFLNKPLPASMLSDIEEFDWSIAFDLSHHLLKQGLDLFNLIPDGLAIDKTTL